MSLFTFYHIHHKCAPLVDFQVDEKWHVQLVHYYSWICVDIVGMQAVFEILEDGFVCGTAEFLDTSAFFYIEDIWRHLEMK